MIKEIIKKIIFKGSQPKLVDTPEKIFHNDNLKSILLLRQDRIGDVLISIPIIRNIRSIFPEQQIDILLGDKNIQTSNALGKYVNRSFHYRKNIFSIIWLVLKLKRKNYSLIIDLFDNASITSSILIKLIKPNYSLGMNKENFLIYTHIVPMLPKHKFHIIERLSIILMAFGNNPDNADLSTEYPLDTELIEKAKFKTGYDQNSSIVGINISGSNESKYWGLENNILFINELINKYNDIEIMIFGTKDYQEELNKIKDKTGVKLAPLAKTLDEYASMLSLCDIIISPDTAAVHFASAFKKPCIAFYTYISEDFGMPWFPYKTPFIPMISSSDSIRDIKADQVLIGFDQLYKLMK